jgi:hypothetical protein
MRRRARERARAGARTRARPGSANGYLLALFLSLSACAGLRGAFSSAPHGVPSGREGWLRYSVGQLRLEAPEGWTRSGEARHLRLDRPGGGARLEVSTPEAAFETLTACMADAERVMKRGEGMERARSHPTRFAGLRALSLEGDQSGWHVWAWAACDGGVQYQVFLTAQTPAPAEVVEVYRSLVSGARVGGEA